MNYYFLVMRGFSKLRSKTPKFSAKVAIPELRSELKEPERESFDLILKMGLDPSISEHNIRGNVFLPSGTGKQKKIGVFVPESKKKLAIELGAFLAGDELLEQVKLNKIEFEQVLATADMIDALKPLARTLGQKGLMPTTRNNTLIPVEDFEKEMEKLKKGMVNYKLQKNRMIMSSFGKARFTDLELLLNLKALLEDVFDSKPKNFTKKFIESAKLTTTYGRSIELNLALIDVNSYKYELANLR